MNRKTRSLGKNLTRPKPASASRTLARRLFLRDTGFLTAAAALIQMPDWLGSKGWLQAAEAATPDLVHDTFNALIAFVVPGPDPYSVAQGVSTVEPGGLDADVAEVLIETLDHTTPFLPAFSAVVASILNGVGQQVNPTAAGPFLSPFARLSFAEKAAVFQIMDGTDSLKPLAGVLPAFVAFFCYSEAAMYDPATRSLTGEPLAWELSSYQGVADGRDEFLGYFENRRKVQ